jgi:hypothetical protein
MGFSSLLLIIVKSVFLLAKLYLFIKAYLLEISKPPYAYVRNLWHLVGIFLVCKIVEDILFITKVINYVGSPLFTTPSDIIINVLGYCALGFFLEKLIHKPVSLQLRHGAFIVGLWQPSLALLPSIIFVGHQLRTAPLPRILGQQLQQFLRYFLIPHTFLAVVTLGQPLVTGSLYQIIFIVLKDMVSLSITFFCMRYLLRSAPLQNIIYRQRSSLEYLFAFQFKDTLTQLGQVISFADLENITCTYFSETFHLNPQDIGLHAFPPRDTFQSDVGALSPIEELLFDPAHESLQNYMVTRRLLVRDDIALDFYYEETEEQKSLLHLLDFAQADCIIPIYQQDALLAYITVQRNALPHRLFSDIEHYKMRLYAGYISSIVNLLQHKNLAEIARQEHSWQEELYYKQQELKHYKESIRTLMAAVPKHTVGVIHYSCKKLIWMSENAYTLFGIKQNDTPENIMHAHAIKDMAQNALRYRTEQHITLRNHEDSLLRCTAIPCDDSMHSIILIHRADSSDQFSVPLEQLKDVSSWSYALYLGTTTSGKLINQLIPDPEKALLNVKIELLKIALSKKATLLTATETDLEAIVQIIHHISLRSHLHICNLKEPEQGLEIAMQLFGVEPIAENSAQQGLLNTLHNTGTLYIQNVEHLSIETQQRLAVYITTGMFLPYKGTIWLRSNVRIICSTRTDLEALVSRTTFSQELLKEFSATSIALPSIPRINFSEPTIDTGEEHNTIEEAPETPNPYPFRPSPADLSLFSPEVTRAIALGKEALKDKRLMSLLWETFQSQTTIATLLKVNPSLVNRRCKELNLPPDNAIS